MLASTPSSAKRTRDSAQLNALVSQRFVASNYAAWPQDQKRDWRNALADELNRRAVELHTTADWDARRVQNKLNNLRLHVPRAAPATPSAATAATPSRVLPLSFSFKPPLSSSAAAVPPPPPPPTPLAAANHTSNAHAALCESIDELSLNDNDNDDNGENRRSSTPTLPPPPSLSPPSPTPLLSSWPSPPPPLPSFCSSPPPRSPSPPQAQARPLDAYMRDAQAALIAACTHGAHAFHHNGLRGSAVERVLCDFIRSHCSSAFVGVSSGEVMSLAVAAGAAAADINVAQQQHQQRRQFDCVLYDTRIPTFAPSIVPDAPRLFFSPGVLCVLEFKTTLSSTELGTALTAARTLCESRTPYIIVALRSQLTLSALRDALVADAPPNVLGAFVLDAGSCLLSGADARIVRDDERCTLGALTGTLITLGQRASAASTPPALDVEAFL